MAGKRIAIIGAGMGGLAAGIYGQLNGYETEIFEMHSLPGGQCTAYRRKGYTFDVCIHHLFGCAPGTGLHQFWQEIGAMPRETTQPADCVSVRAPDGRLFSDYYDTERLREHLLELAPEDAQAIQRYVRAAEQARRFDFLEAMMFRGPGALIRGVPQLLPLVPFFRMSMADLGMRFTDPFLRRAFPLLVYSLKDAPAIVHVSRKARGLDGDVAWPVGGAAAFARSIERRYRDLGGVVHYQAPVDKILVQDDAARGLRLADGTTVGSDIVISNADGRATIRHMLDGRYMNRKIAQWCEVTDEETNWAVHVFLGVNRDLSNEPSSLVMLLDEPVEIAGHTLESLEMQLYGHDPSMAPAGKGVIKVELVSRYSYWSSLAQDPARYREEKERVVEHVLSILETHFHGIREQVEAVDVPTLLTWERYMGGTHGFANMPNRKMNIVASVSGSGMQTTLPGLADFYMVGVWSTMAGALFMNALSGKHVIRDLCRQDDRRFTASG